MARPINSPRGLIARSQYIVVGGDASKTQTTITGDANGMVVSRGLKLTGQISVTGTSRVITANSTGWLLGTRYISTNGTGNVST